MSPQEKTLLLVRKKVGSLWAPPKSMTILEWAETYRVIPNGNSPRPGRYVALPHQRYLQQHLGKTYSEAIVCLPSQLGGKTEMMLNITGYYMHAEPASILIKYPTIDSAEGFSGAKLAPMIEATPVLRKLVSPAKSRDSSNTIRCKKYPGGTIDLVGAESAPALRQKTKRVIEQDEIDSDEDTREGDSVALADKRAVTFDNAVKIKISTPTIKGFSRIEREREKTNKGSWTVCCPKCNHRQWFKWGQVKWDNTKIDGPKHAVIECANAECRHGITDKERIEAYYKTGDYVFENPTSKVLGIWANGLTCGVMGLDTIKYDNYLEQWIHEFLEAKRGGPETLKVWINTFCCESWEEEAVTITHEPLLLRCENYHHEVPRDVVLLVGSVDVQDDRLEAEIIGYGAQDQSWGIGYKIFMGDPNLPTVWEMLDEWLFTPRKHASGVEMLPYTVAVDTGHKNDYAYEFIRQRWEKRYYAIKGSSVHGLPIVGRPGKSGVRKVKLFMVGTGTGKSMVYSRLKIDDPSHVGYCHFPKGRGYDEEYFKQLTAEKIINEYKGGKKTQKWEKTRDRNEALDIRVYGLAAYSLAVNYHNVRIDKLAEAMNQKMEALEKEPEKPEGTPPPRTPPPKEPEQTLEQVKQALNEGRPLRAQANPFVPPVKKRKLASFKFF